MSQEKTKILFLDSSLDRANSIRERFPQATHVISVSQAIEAIRKDGCDVLIINSDLGHDEEIDIDDYLIHGKPESAMELINWLLIYMPVIRRIFIIGSNFDDSAYMRAALQASGYPALYHNFSHLLTYTSI